MADYGAHDADILSIYTRDVARRPLLTRDEELALGARAQQGDEEAIQELVERNLRFVIRVAMGYRRSGISLMDLIQAGSIGLMHAARKFDPERGVKFVSYAVYWIRQAIQKQIDAESGTVRPSQTQSGRVRRVRKMQERARQEKGRELSVEEIQEETGFTADRIDEALQHRISIRSLDEPVGPDDGSQLTLAQIIGNGEDRDEMEREGDLTNLVNRVMQEVLSEREQVILRDYYGFNGGERWSLTHIGVSQGISRERVRQIKVRGLRKMTEAIRRNPTLVRAFAEVFVTEEAMEGRRERFASGRGTADEADLLPAFAGIDDDE